jgi:hypothetical protein
MPLCNMERIPDSQLGSPKYELLAQVMLLIDVFFCHFKIYLAGHFSHIHIYIMDAAYGRNLLT